jgi:hypothetical protein
VLNIKNLPLASNALHPREMVVLGNCTAVVSLNPSASAAASHSALVVMYSLHVPPNCNSYSLNVHRWSHSARLPSFSWYFPIGQLVHDELPLFEYFPASQVEQ